jgi:osmotically-inducible protein OsmY
MISQVQPASPQIDASALRNRILDVLSTPGDISVAICGTKVALSGAVHSQRDLKMAAAVASVTEGVAEVVNSLEVVSMSESGHHLFHFR